MGFMDNVFDHRRGQQIIQDSQELESQDQKSLLMDAGDLQESDEHNPQDIEAQGSGLVDLQLTRRSIVGKREGSREGGPVTT